MKMPRFSTHLIVAGIVGFACASCSKTDRDDATSNVKDAYHDSKDAVVDAWHDVKSYTFERRSEFSAEAKARSEKIESQISRLKADRADAKASASRQAAFDELKSSRADFKSKVDALGDASADTWDSAKANVSASWDRLKAAYDKARAD